VSCGLVSRLGTSEPRIRSTNGPSNDATRRGSGLPDLACGQPDLACGQPDPACGQPDPACGQPELSGDDNPGTAPPSAVRGIAGQVVANTSLLIAVLVYMGWAYDDALFGYFNLSPLDLDVGIVEYMLRSLSLFSPGLVLVAVVITVVAAVRSRKLARTTFARLDTKAAARLTAVPALRRFVPAPGAAPSHPGQVLLIGAGAAITVMALSLAWAAGHTRISTYLILALLGSGPLLLTWPDRAQRHGRFPYSLAIVISAVCALWATSLYAHNIGTQDAQAFVRDLPQRTSVVVYSTQRLALSGPGLSVQQLPPEYYYRFEYQGLRLLITRSGTYYLLPVGWSPRFDITYVFTDSDQIRIELLSGVVRSG
jgi:hypothetical protein